MKSIYDLKVPIIQGAMGIGISLGNLAGAVAREGAMGTISAVGIGYKEADFYQDSLRANIRALKKEVDKAKQISNGNGIIAVNVMNAITQYKEMCLASAKAGAEAIVCGAGLPLNLPEIVNGFDIMLAPIVSSAKALKVIVKHWKKKYDKIPDFLVLEGPKAGGHLGFKKEQLNSSLSQILSECIDMLKNLEFRIPIFVAGAVNTYDKIKHYQSLGAFGAQIATRFILTFECEAHDEFKRSIQNAKDEDIQIIQSPVGMPGRAVSNAFLKKMLESRIAPKRCIDCLTTCDPATTKFCICEKLIASANGNVDEGLLFCSAQISEFNQITTVKEVIDECWNKK